MNKAKVNTIKPILLVTGVIGAVVTASFFAYKKYTGYGQVTKQANSVVVPGVNPNSDNKKRPSPTPTAVITTLENGWVHYQNKEEGFEIQYPKQAEMGENFGGGVDINYYISEGTREKGYYGLEILYILTAYDDRVKETAYQAATFEKIPQSTVKEIQVGNRTGYYYSSVFNEAYDYPATFYYLPADSYKIAVVRTSFKDNEENYFSTTLEKIVASYKPLKNEPQTTKLGSGLRQYTNVNFGIQFTFPEEMSCSMYYETINNLDYKLTYDPPSINPDKVSYGLGYEVFVSTHKDTKKIQEDFNKAYEPYKDISPLKETSVNSLTGKYFEYTFMDSTVTEYLFNLTSGGYLRIRTNYADPKNAGYEAKVKSILGSFVLL